MGAISIAYQLGAELDPRVGSVLRETTARLATDIRAGLSGRQAPWLPTGVTDPEVNLLRNVS